jgi:hypothetical protein
MGFDNHRLFHPMGGSRPDKEKMKDVVMKFLEEKIITRFSVPAKITTNNAKDFSLI